MIELIRDPRVVVCRFEDLVGPLGGGTLEQQYEQILAITNAFNIELSQDKLNFLAENVYASAITSDFNTVFRRGQIGSWKESFTEENKKICKETMGKALIQLGYEKDYEW